MIRQTSPRRALLVLALILFASPLLTASDIGPTNGHLVVVGGAMKDPAIVERFVTLAGGPEVPIVVIPTAGGGDHYDQYWTGLGSFKEAGATKLTVLHTRDRAVADSEAFVKPIREARGVWFTGGRQWRLADSYLNTRTHDELRALLDRGGVIGGSSAGATIQGSYLVRGDSKTNTIMMGDHEEGLSFLRNVGIDQHLLMRNRQHDMIEVIEAHPELLGIGLDEDTAIVVSGDSFEVIGQGYVAIYDNQRLVDSGGRFYFLAPGDRYDMMARQARRRTLSDEPFSRIEEKKWDYSKRDKR
jgi:cyanophycinase